MPRSWTPFILALLCCPAFDLHAQIDNEFWFAAPAVTIGHGDRPVLLRLTTFDEAATITIDQPANPSWPPIQLQIPARQSRSVDLTFRLDFLESEPAFTPLNRGLHILSDQPITVYYEVNFENNPDIFSLKGRNALGRNFMIPAQNWWTNYQWLEPPASSSFDLVATQDATLITIIPSVTVRGHRAGEAFEILLDRGQTYSVEAAGFTIADQLTGSRVTSDKPIAITLKDDSNLFDPCYDLSGDQLVPVEVLGTEYVVVRGFLSGGDRVFVMATEDQTEVTVDGNTPLQLNAGEMHQYLLTNYASSITTSAPVYVLHATGFGCEIGFALLPRIDCTGSQSVSFTRSTREFFGIMVITEKGRENAFMLNNSTNAISEADFAEVPGTGGRYVVAQLNLSSGSVDHYNLQNSMGTFHVGIINGGERTGTRYAYFSDFKALKVQADVTRICLGAEMQLRATGSDQVRWLAPMDVAGSTSPEILVAPETTTTYTVMGSDGSGGCADTASIDLEVYAWPRPDVSVSGLCLQETTIFRYAGDDTLSSLQWIVGRDTFLTDRIDSVAVRWPSTGTYQVQMEAINPAGCLVDTTFTFAVAGVDFLYDSSMSVIRGERLPFDFKIEDGVLEGATFNWSPPDGLSCSDCPYPEIMPVQTTDYWLTVTDSSGCISRFHTRIFVDEPVFIPNAFSPNNDGNNDVFKPYGPDLELEEFLILDRWGEICFKWTADEQSGEEPFWDGSLRGRPMPAGTYLVYLRGYHGESGNEFEKSSSLHLIR